MIEACRRFIKRYPNIVIGSGGICLMTLPVLIGINLHSMGSCFEQMGVSDEVFNAILESAEIAVLGSISCMTGMGALIFACIRARSFPHRTYGIMIVDRKTLSQYGQPENSNVEAGTRVEN